MFIVSVFLFVVQKCCQKPRPGARAYDHAIRAQWYMGGLFVWSACLLKTRHHKKKIKTTGATPPLPDCNWKLDFLTKQETATRDCHSVSGQRHGTVSLVRNTASVLNTYVKGRCQMMKQLALFWVTYLSMATHPR